MTPATTPRVAGLDPSLTSAGLALVGEGTSVRSFTSKGAKDATLPERRARLRALADSLVDQIVAFAPTLVVIEAPAFSRVGGSNHDRSGLWWTVVHRVFDAGLPVLEVPPSCRAKYATGKGNAGKDEVIIAVTRRYPTVAVTNNDEADALVLAAMGCRLLGQPIEDLLPLPNTAALATLRLPKGL